MNAGFLGEKVSSNVWGALLGAVVGAALGFLSQNYFSEGRNSHEYNQSVEERLHADDIAIDALKITVTALGVEVKGTESSIAQILASQSANAATLQILKDSADTQKEATSDIKQQLNSIIDSVRPIRSMPRN